MTQSSRKRSRLCDEEGCEFMPISKRINKLHIRSGQLNSDEEGQKESLIQDEHTNVNGCDITSGPSHAGSNGFLQQQQQTNGGPSSYGCGPLSADSAMRLSSATNGCSNVDGVVRQHGHHHQQQHGNQSQMNGSAITGMNASTSSASTSSSSSSSSMSQMYHHHHNQHCEQNGVDHLMDNGSTCHDRGEAGAGALPSSRLHVSDDDSLECQLQALSRMHQQMQESQVANYDPSLTESQNPFYYEVNEMLYRLHVLRMQRMAKNGV